MKTKEYMFKVLHGAQWWRAGGLHAALEQALYEAQQKQLRLRNHALHGR
jgi:hypothetical protein